MASIHRGIVNLSARDEAGHYFISVISDPIHWTELAILVSPDHPWWGQHRSAGDRVAVSELGALPAPPPQPGSVAAGGQIPAPVVEAAREALLREFRATGFVALLSPEAPRDDPFVRRAAGLLEHAPDRTVSSISSLIGLGIGFTPAGDDFVSGVLLAQTLLTGAPPSERDRSAIFSRLSGTTAGGSSLLRVAAAGVPPAYQLALVDTLRTGAVAHTIDAARHHGHSSGLDALSGLLWRLAEPE
ncbi:MAG: DUF2877 domain-containing protein [Alkalispirochaeta sp.]